MMTFPVSKNHCKNLLGLVAVATLAACSQTPMGTVSRPAMIQPVGNAQLMGDVIDLLDKGNETAARKRLRQMVKRAPTDVAATKLLDSISADPIAQLGARSFEYRVQPGDRMIELAQRYLGDRLKFYALARYNEIKVPASLKAGQLIHIPGDAPPPRPAPRPTRSEPASPSEPVRTTAPVPVKPAPQAKADPARAARLRGAGLAALSQGQVAKAVVLLHQAAALDPQNALIKRDLERAQRIRQTVKAKR